MHFLKMILIASLFLTISAKAQDVNNSSQAVNKSNYFNSTSILSEDFNFVLKGEIKNYKHTDKNGFVLVRTYSINGKMKSSKIAVQTDGTFMFHGQQDFEGNISFFFSDLRDIPLYIKPYETITLEIDEEKWVKGGLASGGLKIHGPSAGTSERMIEFRSVLEKHVYKNDNNTGTKMSDSAMAEGWLKRRSEELEVLDAYIKQKNISDSLFINWYRNEIEMNALSEINEGLFVGRINDKVSYDQFIYYTKPVSLFNRPAFQNSSFYKFLNHFATDILIIGNVNPVYKDSLKNNISHHISFLKKYASGLVLDILYCDLYKDKMPESAFNKLDSAIASDYAKRALRKFAGIYVNFKRFNVLDSLDKIPGGKAVAGKLKAILNRHPGNYIFLDFWSTWCGPCMSEMPMATQLAKRFSDKPLTMLFLSQNQEGDGTQKTKEKFGLQGEFLDLNPNETSVYNIVFDFDGIPVHFLIDNKGNLVTRRLPGISSGDGLNNELVEILDKIVLK